MHRIENHQIPTRNRIRREDLDTRSEERRVSPAVCRVVDFDDEVTGAVDECETELLCGVLRLVVDCAGVVDVKAGVEVPVVQAI